jgi:CRP-like cAMP-binding protein
MNYHPALEDIVNIELSSGAHQKLIRRMLLHLGGVSRNVPFGTALFLEGDPLNQFSYLRSGSVKIERTHGADSVLLSVVQAPAIVCDSAVYGERTYSFTAVALENCVVVEIPVCEVLSALSADASLWRSFAYVAMQRQRATERAVALLKVCDVEKRLALTLCDLCEHVPCNPGDGWALTLSQGELANLIGAVRETTSTALNRLARRGFVQLGRRSIRVVNPVCLRESLRCRQAMAARP